MVDQLNKSAGEESQLRRDALQSSGVPGHGTGDRSVMDKSNPDEAKRLNKDGVRKDKEGGDEQDLADAVVRPDPHAHPSQTSAPKPVTKARPSDEISANLMSKYGIVQDV